MTEGGKRSIDELCIHECTKRLSGDATTWPDANFIFRVKLAEMPRIWVSGHAGKNWSLSDGPSFSASRSLVSIRHVRSGEQWNAGGAMGKWSCSGKVSLAVAAIVVATVTGWYRAVRILQGVREVNGIWSR